MSEDGYVLLIDIGNSRVKWGCGKRGKVERGEPFSSRDGQAVESLMKVLEGDSLPAEILVSNVAGEAIAKDLQALAESRWRLTPRFVRSQSMGFGVVSGYSNPEKLGVDRWAALVGARRACGDAVCVADAGTAMTWDVLDASGRHLGGLISPGLELMRESLARGTSGLAAVEGTVRESLATDTASAIWNGTLRAAAGFIERAFFDAARRLGEKPRLLLTGGNEPAIAAELEIPYESRPDLVLEGLYVMAGDRQQAN